MRKVALCALIFIVSFHRRGGAGGAKIESMDTALILTDRLLQVIRDSGASKIEAYSALKAAGAILTSVEDISFRNDLPKSEPCQSEA